MRYSVCLLLGAVCFSTVYAAESHHEHIHQIATRGPKPNRGCDALATVVKNATFTPGSDVYEYEKTQFWSNTQLLDPGCIFRPQTAGDVAAGIKALADNQASFAVRGGGHMGIPVSNHMTVLQRR